MKATYISLAFAVVSAKQFDPCTKDSECGNGFFCKPTDDKKFSMCQPNEAKGDGKQYSVCKNNGDCQSGFFCKPTNDKTFSMCQPNESCGKRWSQCGGSSFVGSSCCEDGSSCKKWNTWYSQCVPKDWVRDAEQYCINVSVEGDATYCSKGSICGGGGWSCPKKGDVAVADCVKTLTSYVGANAKCVAPEDATCKKIKTGAWGCVWNSKAPQKDAGDDEQSCTNVSVVGDATYCVKGPICGDQGDACPKKGDVAVADCIKTLNSYVDASKCVAPSDATCQKIPSGARGCVFGAVPASTGAPATTSAPASTSAPGTTSAATTLAPAVTSAPSTTGANNNKQCSTNWSQCNGQNWPYGVCCQDPSFQCNKKNDYLSLCEPKDKKRDAEDAAIDVWQQCGGNNYNGQGSCTTGNKCVKIDEYYHQCQPDENKPGQPAWSQCGGKGYTGSTECQEGNVCNKYNDFYSQCIPHVHQRSHMMGEDQEDVAETPTQGGGHLGQGGAGNAPPLSSGPFGEDDGADRTQGYCAGRPYRICCNYNEECAWQAGYTCYMNTCVDSKH